MRQRLAAAGLLLLLPSLSSCGLFAEAKALGQRDSEVLAPNGIVVRVVDGDTMIIDIEGVDTKVRMIGFDTPETVDPRSPVECFGKEASNHLKSLSPAGTRVRLERDTEQFDRYRRTLGYVYRASDGMFLNLQMVRDGYANTLSIEPNTTYAAEFLKAEREARNNGLGLWSKC